MPALAAAGPGRHRRATLFALLLLAATVAEALPRHAPTPGGVAVVRLGHAIQGDVPPSVSFNALPQPVVRDHGNWVALVGIPLTQAPGQGEITVERSGRSERLHLDVRARNYPTQRLTIADDRLVKPPPELAARIAEEQQRLTQLKQHFSPAPEPDVNFVQPVAGRLSASFGARRILNGEARAPHAGLDIAVAAGRPVVSAAAGTVIAVDDFYFAGHTVVVDHGRGIVTLYAHLSRADVEVGQALRRGDRIGLSGKSGRATGPHLHWGVMVGGSSVDPRLFIK